MTMALFVEGIINYVRDGVRTVLAQRWLLCMGSPLDSSVMNNTSLCISSILLVFTLLSFFVTLLDVTYCKRGRQGIKKTIFIQQSPLKSSINLSALSTAVFSM